MGSFRLAVTAFAEQDLRNIYYEGIENWGFDQADRYYDGLLIHFDIICDNPYLYMAIDHIRPGYRRSVYDKHSIYYRVIDDVIEVAAILKQQDLSGRLP